MARTQPKTGTRSSWLYKLYGIKSKMLLDVYEIPSAFLKIYMYVYTLLVGVLL